MEARLGPRCPEPEMPFPLLTAGCQQKQEGIREELQVTTTPSPASLPTPAAFQPSPTLPISSVPLGKRLFHHKKTRFNFCPCSFTDSNDLWQHSQEPSPQVAGLTDAQTPRNNSSRSKSTITATQSNAGDTEHGLSQAEAQVAQGICLHSLSFIKILLAGMQRGKSGMYLC